MLHRWQTKQMDCLARVDQCTDLFSEGCLGSPTARLVPHMREKMNALWRIGCSQRLHSHRPHGRMDTARSFYLIACVETPQPRGSFYLNYFAASAANTTTQRKQHRHSERQSFEAYANKCVDPASRARQDALRRTVFVNRRVLADERQEVLRHRVVRVGQADFLDAEQRDGQDRSHNAP